MAIVVEMDVQLALDDVRGDTEIAAAVNHVLAWTAMPSARQGMCWCGWKARV
jgi:hypothetical protein